MLFRSDTKWYNKFSMIFHFVAFLFSLAISLALISVFFTDKNRASFYIANSILSAYETTNPRVTYYPVSSPLESTKISSIFFNCLRKAQYAVNTPYNCSSDVGNGYEICLQNLTTPTFRVNKMIAEIKNSLQQYSTNSTELIQLPSPLTSDNLEGNLRPILSSNISRKIGRAHV